MGQEKVEGFDRILGEIGSFGCFQGLVLFCMTLQALLSWHHLSAVFLAAVPLHWCKIKALESTGWTQEEVRNISIPKFKDSSSFDACSYYDYDYDKLIQLSNGSFESAYQAAISGFHGGGSLLKCNDWDWDTSIYHSTVVSKFNLVCGRRLLVGTIQGSYMTGVLVGSLLFGSLSDQLIGRRGSVLISCVISLVAGFASGLATSYEAFIFFRFILAAGVAGAYQNAYVLMLEYASPSSRAGLGLLGQVSFAFGYMFLALFGYYFRDWSHLQLALSAAGLLLISYYWILPESARWLLYRGKDDEAFKILCFAAKLNWKPVPDQNKLLALFHHDTNLQLLKTESIQEDSQSFASRIKSVMSVAVVNYWNLLRTPEIRKRTLLIWSLFIIVDLVYYGVVFDSATLTKDPFLLVFLAGTMELPAYTLVIPALTLFGRRPTVVGTFLFTAISSFCVVYIPPEFEVLRISVSMAGKLFITTSFAVLYLLGAELFPTSTRTTGLASAVIMGRLGSILAPFVVDMLKTHYHELPNIIFGLVSITAAFAGCMLPETRDMEMFDDVNELENSAVMPVTINELVKESPNKE